MAIISPNVSAYIAAMRRDPACWTALRAANPSKAQLCALIQGLEDWYESNLLTAKAAMEAKAGITITNAFAKKVSRVWMQIKFGGE